MVVVFLFWILFACPDVYIIILDIYPYFPPGYSVYPYLFFSYVSLYFAASCKSSWSWLGKVSTHLPHMLPPTFPVPLADITSKSQFRNLRIFPTHHSRNAMWLKKDVRKVMTVIMDCISLSGNGSSSVQFSHSVVSNSLWPMDCSTPGLPVHHQLLEFTQTHVHWVGDAIQPSHPLSSPSPPALNPSQHQGLFQWVSSSHQVAKVLEFQH